MEPEQKQYPAVDVTGDRSKVRCCKEQYCIGTWNVRSMNQGKLEVVKREMARVNVDSLGISELNGLEWVNPSLRGKKNLILQKYTVVGNLRILFLKLSVLMIIS